MRHVKLFLPLLFAALLFVIDAEPRCGAAVAPRAELRVDSSEAEAWLCRQRCNSDLNLPRSVEELTPQPQTFASPVRGAVKEGARALHRGPGAWHGSGRLKNRLILDAPIFRVGGRPADYYLLCLCRLII